MGVFWDGVMPERREGFKPWGVWWRSDGVWFYFIFSLDFYDFGLLFVDLLDFLSPGLLSFITALYKSFSKYGDLKSSSSDSSGVFIFSILFYFCWTYWFFISCSFALFD